MTTLDLISKILLIILLIMQIIVMIYLFVINRKRFEEDKKFWAQLDEEIQRTKEKYQLYLLDENPKEENIKSEQDK